MRAERVLKVLKTIRISPELICSTMLFIAAAPDVVNAEEHGHGHVPSIADLTYFYINFALYLLVLVLLLRKPIASMWTSRRGKIEEAVNSGRAASEAAQKRVTEAQAKLSSLSATISALQAQIEREAEAEAQQILTEAREAGEKLQIQAGTTLDGERRALERKIRVDVVDAVMAKVRERLSRELTPERDRSLRSAALDGVRAFLQ